MDTEKSDVTPRVRQPALPQAGPRSIRVFISSPFRDMQEEREHLIKRIFPQIRKLCESRRVLWIDVDLRWGITDEQKTENRVIPICLAEIDKCRPFFIGLLGERYGPTLNQVDPALLQLHRG